jgi:hypothetical protein
METAVFNDRKFQPGRVSRNSWTKFEKCVLKRFSILHEKSSLGIKEETKEYLYSDTIFKNI